MNATRLEDIRFEAFAKMVGAKFRVQAAPDNSVELELVEVTPPRLTAAGGPTKAVYENFTLVFRGPAERLLPQQIHSLQSEQWGTYDLFMVPVARDATAATYEATFNRLVKR